jgi:hypothetical protein
MKSLTSTFLFQQMDAANNLKNQIGLMTNPANILSKDSLKVVLDIIKRRYNYALKAKILSEVDSDSLIFVYNDKALNLPHFIPAVGMIGTNGKPVAYVNLTGQGRFDKLGNFDIDGRKLFAYMQTGYIIKELAAPGRWTQISTNITILKGSMIMFAKLINKVLDRTYAINLNKMRADYVSYVSSKFFLTYQMERHVGESLDNLAYTSCFNGTTKSIVTSIDSTWPETAYTTFDGFIAQLATIDGLGGLTTRNFVEGWVKMYNFSTVLGLEYYPYFLHAMFGAMVGAHINSEYVIEPLTGKEAAEVYTELGRLLR